MANIGSLTQLSFVPICHLRLSFDLFLIQMPEKRCLTEGPRRGVEGVALFVGLLPL
jgi:hypothetical protein